MTDRNPSGGSPLLALLILAIAFAAMLLAGCTVGPDYKRPDVDLPKEYGIAQASVPAPERWWAVFNDPVLDRMVEEALAANRDLRAAAERIEQGRAQFTITRADQLPSAGIEASKSRSKASALGSVPIPEEFLTTNNHRLVLRFAWEIDFWGKYRRASEAAGSFLDAIQSVSVHCRFPIKSMTVVRYR